VTEDSRQATAGQQGSDVVRVASGVALGVAGVAVSCIGFGLLAHKGTVDASPQHTWLALLCAVVGIALLEVGLWLNARFYRGLAGSALGGWLELGGGIVLVLGVALFGNALAFWLVSSSAGPVVVMAIGLLLIELALAAEHRHVIRLCTSPSFPMTLIVLAAGVLGVAALALLSIINVRHYRRVDLTGDELYTLNDQTVKILKSVKRPLRIVGAMVPNPNPRSGMEQFNNVVRARADEMLREYGSQSRHVEFTSLDFYADPQARAKLEDQYKIEILRDSVVFIYEPKPQDYKTKVVQFNELIQQAPIPNIPPQFKGEEVFTSALQSLIEGTMSKVYFVIGHGEKDIEEFDRDGLSDLAEAVRNDNCEVRTCELPEIPDDCNVLVIAGPQKAFLPGELDAVRKYINEGGGNLIVLLDPVVGDTARSGLEDLLREQGITVETDHTIVDISQLEVLPGLFGSGPSVTVATTDYPKGRAGMWPTPHPITREMKKIRTAYYMACPVSSEMRPGPRGPQPNPYNVELVRSSSRSSARPDLDPATLGRQNLDTAGGKPGPLSIAVARGKWMPQEMPPTPMMGMPPRGRLAVFGDSDFVTNMFLKQGATGNLTLFRNTVAWVAGKEYKIGIPPKPLQQDRRLDLTDEDKSFARWATVIVPPFHILLIGVVVWWLRRR